MIEAGPVALPAYQQTTVAVSDTRSPGHANVSQTSTYLNATRVGLQDSMRRFDDSAARCNPVAAARTDPQPPRNDEGVTIEKAFVN